MMLRLLSFFMITACAIAAPTEVTDEPIIIAYGRAVSIPSGPALRFAAVEEDSRCPAGVQCIWAGNARVRIDAIFDGETQKLRLNTTVDPKTGAAFGFTIELLDVMPGATAPSQAEPNYSVRISVKKTAEKTK